MTRHIAGHIHTAAGPMPYATAQARYDSFVKVAAEVMETAPELARDLAREAIDLCTAIQECARYRRAAGWTNPADADRKSLRTGAA